MVQGFTGSTEVALPLECTYDFEVTAVEVPARLARRHASRCNSCSAERFSPRAERGFSVQQVPWDREDHYDMPVAVWRDLIQQHYPNSGLGAAGPRHRRPRWPPTSRRAACWTSTTRSPRCWTQPAPAQEVSDDRRAGTGPAPSPTRCSTRAICSTRTARTSSKNQSRWQFGVLGPPGAADAGIGEDDTLSAQFLVDGDRERSPWWCGSCTCSTAAPNAHLGGGHSNRSTS